MSNYKFKILKKYKITAETIGRGWNPVFLGIWHYPSYRGKKGQGTQSTAIWEVADILMTSLPGRDVTWVQRSDTDVRNTMYDKYGHFCKTRWESILTIWGKYLYWGLGLGVILDFWLLPFTYLWYVIPYICNTITRSYQFGHQKISPISRLSAPMAFTQAFTTHYPRLG